MDFFHVLIHMSSYYYYIVVLERIQSSTINDIWNSDLIIFASNIFLIYI